MGSTRDDAESEEDEYPRHQVFVDAFYIDVYEITVRAFRQFIEETGYKPNGEWQNTAFRQTEDHPVVEVSWWDAIRYCNWRSRKEKRGLCYNETSGACDFSKNGYRLPTEAEWEKAARGTKAFIYPWGNDPPVAGGASKANYSQKTSTTYFYTAPVDAYAAGKSPFGIYQLAGNVWEWCNDWYDPGYYREHPRKNPTGPARGVDRVLRGGFWFSSSREIRAADRVADKPVYNNEYCGFRCVRKP